MNCARHPERAAVTSLYAGGNYERIGYCKECAPKPLSQRAYATGLGSEASAEALEARFLAAEWERLKATYRETWRK